MASSSPYFAPIAWIYCINKSSSYFETALKATRIVMHFSFDFACFAKQDGHHGDLGLPAPERVIRGSDIGSVVVKELLECAMVHLETLSLATRPNVKVTIHCLYGCIQL